LDIKLKHVRQHQQQLLKQFSTESSSLLSPHESRPAEELETVQCASASSLESSPQHQHQRFPGAPDVEMSPQGNADDDRQQRMLARRLDFLRRLKRLKKQRKQERQFARAQRASFLSEPALADANVYIAGKEVDLRSLEDPSSPPGALSECTIPSYSYALYRCCCYSFFFSY
jgi:hypothetical protein